MQTQVLNTRENAIRDAIRIETVVRQLTTKDTKEAGELNTEN